MWVSVELTMAMSRQVPILLFTDGRHMHPNAAPTLSHVVLVKELTQKMLVVTIASPVHFRHSPSASVVASESNTPLSPGYRYSVRGRCSPTVPKVTSVSCGHWLGSGCSETLDGEHCPDAGALLAPKIEQTKDSDAEKKVAGSLAFLRKRREMDPSRPSRRSSASAHDTPGGGGEGGGGEGGGEGGAGGGRGSGGAGDGDTASAGTSSSAHSRLSQRKSESYWQPVEQHNPSSEPTGRRTFLPLAAPCARHSSCAFVAVKSGLASVEVMGDAPEPMQIDSKHWVGLPSSKSSTQRRLRVGAGSACVSTHSETVLCAGQLSVAYWYRQLGGAGGASGG